jgi:hypothetical protein
VDVPPHVVAAQQDLRHLGVEVRDRLDHVDPFAVDTAIPVPDQPGRLRRRDHLGVTGIAAVLGVPFPEVPVAQPLLTSITGRWLSTQAITYVLYRLGRLLDPASDHPVVAEAARVLDDAGRLHPHQFRRAHAQEAEDAGASVNRIRL